MRRGTIQEVGQISLSEVARPGSLAISKETSEEVLQLLVGLLCLMVSRRQTDGGVDEIAEGLPEPGSLCLR